jgi:hypothetical protein
LLLVLHQLLELRLRQLVSHLGLLPFLLLGLRQLLLLALHLRLALHLLQPVYPLEL